MSERPKPADSAPGPAWTRHLRREVQIVLDLTVLAAAFSLAYLLRFDFQIPTSALEMYLIQLPLVVMLQFAIIVLVGVYRFIWRYVGIGELRTFLIAAALWSVPLLLLRLALPDTLRVWRVPLSITLIDTVLAFGGLLLLRITRRTLYEKFERGESLLPSGGKPPKGKRTLLVGAGQAGVMAARELARQPKPELHVVGFVDDDPSKQGAVLHGIYVLGKVKELSELVEVHQIEQLVVTMARVPREAIRDLVALGEELGVEVRIMPGLYEILEGRVAVSRFREVQIEDLLGREPVELAEEEMARFLTNTVVMVTGAGGSIGAELVRQVARFHPFRLLLVERAEAALFEIEREVRRTWPDVQLEALVVDAGDEDRMRQLLLRTHPDIILHAAAHKHVPLMEKNPCEAVRNNTLATHRLGTIAAEAGVKRFVLVSTDKAVNPTSVMGASKRMAELAIQALDQKRPTAYLAVRFGNVLGSTGSVIPIFREQIQGGGPVTVTHPDMERYFMTIPEAAQLVLQAAAMGGGGEIFILDMGKPIRILDLARDMIRLSGMEPGRDVEIVFSGIRPGEKLYEELELSEEKLATTRHPKIFIGKIQALDAATVQEALLRLYQVAETGDDAAIRALLAELVPEARLGAHPPTARLNAEETGPVH